jgi:uncharacterized protein (TIGR03435 family)
VYADFAREDVSEVTSMRLVLLAIVFVSVCGMPVWGEQQSSPGASAQASAPAFQVATIKPSKLDVQPAIQIQGRRFFTSGTTVVDIMKYAYGVNVSQITGGPEWLGKEKFDSLAEPGTEVRPASDDMKKMVQALLAERFQLTFHRDKKELPVYAIIVAKSGAKLTPTTKGANGIPGADFLPSGRLTTVNATMADFATFMQRYAMERPVVDQTAIKGKYDLSLTWTPDDFQLNGRPRSDDPSAPPGLFTAIQEQLGLRLEATKAPVEVMVIDRVERPSAN